MSALLQENLWKSQLKWYRLFLCCNLNYMKEQTYKPSNEDSSGLCVTLLIKLVPYLGMTSREK